MSDLISRDALFSEFENAGWYDNADRDDVAEELLLNAPTVDAVSVVRCKDCTYCRCNGDIHYLRTSASVFGDDFCSYGERKDGGR